jgi:proteasome accessory factor C
VSDAAVQVDRIVALVAELSRRATEGDGDPTWAELAERFGTTPAQLQQDVRTLTMASDGPGTDWLSSLRIAQEGDGLSLWSGGPFRRPVRLTVAELAAIQVGLAADGEEAPALSRELAELAKPGEGAPRQVGLSLAPGPGEAEVVELAHRAIEERHLLTITYAGAGDRSGTDRAVEPHEVVCADGRFYLVVWCRRAQEWRHFRADRVLGARLESAHFAARPDFTPLKGSGEVFRVHEEPDEVRVRFAPGIARWLTERHPDAALEPDGSAVVSYRVADPAWLVRTVLQYGPEAEVVAPPAYREIMRKALA